jgi:membrane protein DedA with SNARE-associated domain
VTGVVAHHGVTAVFLLMIAAAVVPVGSELIMLYAGAVAGGALANTTVHVLGSSIHSHVWAYVAFAVAGTLGNVVGCAIGWWIGDTGGRALVHRYGRYIHVTDEKLARAERRFDRYDDWAVPLGLAMPLLRSFVAIPSGIVRVPFAKFLILALTGCIIFCFGLAGAGWALGAAYTHAHHDLRYVEYAVVAGVLAAAAYLVYAARVRRARARAADSPR